MKSNLAVKGKVAKWKLAMSQQSPQNISSGPDLDRNFLCIPHKAMPVLHLQ
jgi:hypothetical protein